MSFLFRNLTVQKRKGGAKGGNEGQRFNPNGNGTFNNPNDPSAPKKMLKTDTPLPQAGYHQQYNPAMQGIQQNPLNFGLTSMPNNPINLSEADGQLLQGIHDQFIGQNPLEQSGD